MAEATRDSEVIRGKGDACRNRIFASAYGLDPDFFAFYRSMQSYEVALGEETTIVLSPDSDFLKFLSNPNAKSSDNLPKDKGLIDAEIISPLILSNSIFVDSVYLSTPRKDQPSLSLIHEINHNA